VAGARSLEDDEIPDDIAPFLMTEASGRSLDETGLAKAEFLNVPETVRSAGAQTVLFRVTDPAGEPLARSAAGTLSVGVRTSAGTEIPAIISQTSLRGVFGVSYTAPKGPDAVTIQVRLPAAGGVEPRVETLVVVEE
jgi:hypothetical protein